MQDPTQGTVKSQGVKANDACGGARRTTHHPLRLAIGRALLWFIEPVRDGSTKEIRAALDRHDSELLSRIPRLMIERRTRPPEGDSSQGAFH